MRAASLTPTSSDDLAFHRNRRRRNDIPNFCRHAASHSVFRLQAVGHLLNLNRSIEGILASDRGRLACGASMGGVFLLDGF